MMITEEIRRDVGGSWNDYSGCGISKDDQFVFGTLQMAGCLRQ